MANLEDAKVVASQELSNSKATWVKMERIKYLDPMGKERDWEMASRKSRAAKSDVDGVGIIAIIESSKGPLVILQKQFRPPLQAICIEMPAGLLDPNESVESCALRELREETGYIGKVTYRSPLMFNDPGFTNTNMYLVFVSVDMKDERNQNPVPELEDNEFIETFTVPLEELSQNLERLSHEGYKLDARLQSIASGIQLSRQFGVR
ncbi:BA75_02389T0 [Komagataella pastoris]|uniref:BA75_02389T0 n=1 Tax=Komagataella pastoris TaxID=4922 RepID=A0A1B2JB29_PICPA|nr:BA75_02389T0 [Komagataella pastoris]